VREKKCPKKVSTHQSQACLFSFNLRRRKCFFSLPVNSIDSLQSLLLLSTASRTLLLALNSAGRLIISACWERGERAGAGRDTQERKKRDGLKWACRLFACPLLMSRGGHLP
jgi:hypothetical protein